MVNIRRAQIDDLDGVLALYDKTKKWLSGKGHSHWDKSYDRGHVERLIQDTETYVLEEGGALRGVVSLSEDRPSYFGDEDMKHWEDPGSPALYFSGLAVDPEFHGRGHASKLMQHVEDQAAQKNKDYIRLDVVDSFDLLKSLYERKGYVVKGKRKGGGFDLNLFEKKVK